MDIGGRKYGLWCGGVVAAAPASLQPENAMPGLYKPTYTDRNAAGKTSKRRTAKWYGWYKDESGKKHRVPLSEDKAVAAQMLAKLVRDAERGKAGLTDPVVDAGRWPNTWPTMSGTCATDKSRRRSVNWWPHESAALLNCAASSA